MSIRPLILFILVAGTITPLLHAQPYERAVRDTVAFTPGSVAVENEEGSITIDAWDRDSVAYEARLVSEQDADDVEQAVIEIDRFNERLSLASNFEAVEAEWSFGPEVFGYGVSHPAVHYTLTVPRTAEVSVDDQASTIAVTGLAAALRVDTHEGRVQVRKQKGPVRVDTHEGRVSMTTVDGDLNVDTHEGRVSVQGLRGRLLFDTQAGTAEIGIDSLAAVDIESHEGDVMLATPRDSGFDLSADLDEDASLKGDFAIRPLRTEDGNYEGRLQGGGPLVHLSSHEGDIVLRSR